jgi:hypothetical protein
MPGRPDGAEPDAAPAARGAGILDGEGHHRGDLKARVAMPQLSASTDQGGVEGGLANDAENGIAALESTIVELDDHRIL